MSESLEREWRWSWLSERQMHWYSFGAGMDWRRHLLTSGCQVIKPTWEVTAWFIIYTLTHTHNVYWSPEASEVDMVPSLHRLRHTQRRPQGPIRVCVTMSCFIPWTILCVASIQVMCVSAGQSCCFQTSFCFVFFMRTKNLFCQMVYKSGKVKSMYYCWLPSMFGSRNMSNIGEKN